MTTRTDIERHVDSHPGIHFNELVRELDLATGQVQYHLKRLHDDGRVVADALYGRTHYYTPEYDEWERGALALVRRETSRDIVFYLLEHDTVRPQQIADDLEIARSTLEWHLDHLVDQDVVRKQRNSQNRVTLILPHPGRIVALLETVEPSLPERMVDRFERLLDQMLSGP